MVKFQQQILLKITSYNGLDFLVLYNRQMRYQSKPYRSLSYVQKESLNLRELRDNKDNKENSNILNIPNNKPHKLKDAQTLPLCKPKLEHKISESTASTVLSKETVPELLKRTYTQLITQDYSTDILSHLCVRAEDQKGLLAPHGISASLRSKMVDWMIEVLSSYKMSEQTFFRSVYMMDAYLKNSSMRLEVKDLHLVGVTAMFSASKYEEIHPLKLNIIYDKISRKKFKKQEILEKQSQIISSLSFKLEVPSVLDLARHIIEQLKLNFSESSKKYFGKIVLYLSKMALFNLDLAEENSTLLSGAVVFIALKTLEQVDPCAEPESRLAKICRLIELEEEVVIEVSRKVLDLAKNFSKYYPSLTNLKKFNKFQYGNE